MYFVEEFCHWRWKDDCTNLCKKCNVLCIRLSRDEEPYECKQQKWEKSVIEKIRKIICGWYCHVNRDL